jgi:hypothetical protein
VVHDRTHGDERCLAQRASPKAFLDLIKLSPESKAAFRFWTVGIRGWDRTCPIVADFSPEVLGASDAATESGAG